MRVKAGDFTRIYNPSIEEERDWYINDHCFVRAKNGLWHMFGITHEEPADPLDVKFLAHATSNELLSPQWDRQAHVLHTDYQNWKEVHVWAPHVVEYEDLFYMFYCAGDDDHSRYKIHLATSTDLWEWKRHPGNPMMVDGFDARDPMVLHLGDRWAMYYTATSEPSGGNHVVVAVTSYDLVHWTDKRPVFVHTASGTYGGPTESPFVVARNGKYYLFVCTNTPYDNTAVYESESSFEWKMENQIGEIPAHAAEVIRVSEDEWYVSRCGWGRGGLHLARLEWEDS